MAPRQHDVVVEIGATGKAAKKTSREGVRSVTPKTAAPKRDQPTAQYTFGVGFRRRRSVNEATGSAQQPHQVAVARRSDRDHFRRQFASADDSTAAPC